MSNGPPLVEISVPVPEGDVRQIEALMSYAECEHRRAADLEETLARLEESLADIILRVAGRRDKNINYKLAQLSRLARAVANWVATDIPSVIGDSPASDQERKSLKELSHCWVTLPPEIKRVAFGTVLWPPCEQDSDD